MSHSTVDDLHLAEDALGFLTARVDEIVNLLEAELSKDLLECYQCGGPTTSAGDYDPLVPLRAALELAKTASGHGHDYCRCELEFDDGRDDDNYTCPDDCGCPHDHEHPHPPHDVECWPLHDGTSFKLGDHLRLATGTVLKVGAVEEIRNGGHLKAVGGYIVTDDPSGQVFIFDIGDVRVRIVP